MTMTPAALQIFTAAKAGDAAQVANLLDQEPALLSARDTNGDSLLIAALYRDRREVVELLRARGAETLIWEAAALGDTALLAQMLDADPALLHAYSHDGWTPLHLAGFFDQADAVAVLLARGASVAARSRNDLDNIPLHAALAGAGSVPLVTALLDAGSDVNALQHGGYSPLHETAQNGSLPLTQLLLDRGADPSPSNDDGKTPRDLAAEQGHTDVVTLLETWKSQR
jgi:uncharacterized protein